jgi:site-specific DNA recombinase
MRKNMDRQPQSAQPTIRCALYTRKSTDEGLDKDFNSLDAQRECGEAYILSQSHEGWRCLPDRYDDGGFTGGNMDRPALKRLMADIEAGRIDCVVVYKVDRLSRSLLDFARMMEVFEKHNVSFVSVTQQINTGTSMGRLMMNVLLSFAQFEREIIGERTRDKIRAARRKGKWAGGHPILGYDIDPQGFKLVVNEDEAAQVRTIFDLYLKHEALIPVVQELAKRGWFNKFWTTRKRHERGGKLFTKTSLHKLLTNVAYTGQIKYKTETHNGEHVGIIALDLWQRVQTVLRRNAVSGGALTRNKFGALLKGLVRCVPCNCAMTPSHTTRNGQKRYRYYTCSGAQKRGWNTCPSKAVPAAQLEKLVLQQIRLIGKDPTVVAETFAQADVQASQRIAELDLERRALERDLAAWNADVRTLAVQIGAKDQNPSALARLADLQDRLRGGERRLTEVREEIATYQRQRLTEHEVETALAAFEPVWESLTPREQTRIVQMLVERVDYDGARGKVAITFHPTGIKTLAADLAAQHKEQSA